MDQGDMFAAELPHPGEYPIPPGARQSACVSCGAPIVWARTEQGRAIPLALSTARDCAGRRVAMNHFVDCPQGRKWRRR